MPLPTPPFFLPFNRPLFLEKSLDYIRQAYAERHVSGDGIFTKRCEKRFARYLTAPRALLTTSCTDALEMCALLLDLQPGDEVIMPSFTFVSTANAFVLRGAKPVFVDARLDSFNLDETLIEAAITPRTRAIVVMHYAGVACEMDAIGAIAARHDLAVIEDNAHGLFGTYRGRPLGTFSQLSTLSFHETKNLSCGEGGALIINDAKFVARAEVIREKGTDRTSFIRGEIDKYSWMDVGSSFLPSEIIAAVLWAQIEEAEKIQARRKKIFDTYLEALRPWARNYGVQLPLCPAHCTLSYHLFALLMPTAAGQQGLIDHLKQRNIPASFHYLPLHLSPKGRSLGGKPGDCPVAESIATRLVRLPLYFDLAEGDQARVIQAVSQYLPNGVKARVDAPALT
jgi:dTDP-4-amino-4,6-dideoxygalactose transaminase